MSERYFNLLSPQEIAILLKQDPKFHGVSPQRIREAKQWQADPHYLRNKWKKPSPKLADEFFRKAFAFAKPSAGPGRPKKGPRIRKIKVKGHVYYRRVA